MFPIRDFFSKQFFIFLTVGGTAALVNFFSRFLFRPFLPYVVSVVCAFVVGTILSFFLNRMFTFKGARRDPIGVQATRFAGAALGALLIAALVTSLGIKLYHISGITVIPLSRVESLLHLAAICINVIYSFLVMKYFALKS